MPVLPHAKKALRASNRKTTYNAPIKSRMRNAIKQFRRQPTETNLHEVYSAVDKALKHNLIHHNKAGRLKSRLAKLLLQTSPAKVGVAKKSSLQKTTSKKTTVRRRSTTARVKVKVAKKSSSKKPVVKSKTKQATKANKVKNKS